MLKVKAENENGDLIDLSSQLGFVLTSVTGLTPPMSAVNTSTLATKDGSLYNSSKMNNRNIVLTIKPVWRVEATRVNLYKYIKSKKYIKLYLKTDSRDVYIEGYVESFDGDLYELGQTLQVSVICPDPYFIKKTAETYNFADQAVTVTNSSDFETGCQITLNITGVAENVTITNSATGETFIFKQALENGDKVTIDTRRGKKKLRLTRGGTTTNIINTIDTANTTWLQMIPGDNVLTITADSGAANIGGSVKIQPIYEGL